MSAATAKPTDKPQDPSMDEILASIRRIIADDDTAKPAAEQARSERRTDEDDDEVLDLAEMPTSRRSSPADLEIEVPDLSFGEAAPEAPAMPEQPQAVRAEPSPRQPIRETVRPEPSPPIAALVSSETVASVGQAFNLLSHTILSQNTRTLEDLVQDLLKPMLKTWLDDNLPPLVERLVRAEIERVARGQR